MGSGKKLGSVIIPLDTIDQSASPSKPTDQAMEYSIHGSLNQELVATITAVMWWNEALLGGGDDKVGSGGAMSSAEEIIPEAEEVSSTICNLLAMLAHSPNPPQHADEMPNELSVSILRAKDLAVMDSSLVGKGSSDPRVTVKVGASTIKTECIKKNLNPVWNEKVSPRKLPNLPHTHTHNPF